MESVFSELEAAGWKVVHTGGGVFVGVKDFPLPRGGRFGVVAGVDRASAYRSGERLLTAAEIEAVWMEGGEAEEVILVSPDGVTEEGAALLGGSVSEVSRAVEGLS